MQDAIAKQQVSVEKRINYLRAFPCFATLSKEQLTQLAGIMKEVTYKIGEQIVVEDELIDSIYVIARGTAEVTKIIHDKKNTAPLLLAVLHAGESIGLNDTGFYSSTGKRTATVIATSDSLLLQLDLKALYAFLQKNNLESSMNAASAQMLRMGFIKQCLPFAKLSSERLKWLAERVEEIQLPAQTILFSQGEIGDQCYLIESGEIEIIADQMGVSHQLALLTPAVLFGEATFITRTRRNATARTLMPCKLLVLRYEHLSELLETEQNVANMFMSLMVDRSLPLKNSAVTIHQRRTADGHTLTILKNPQNGHYFKLSNEGAFIWEQLDGMHTLQEITLDLANKYDVFAPEMVAGLISKLTQGGFVNHLTLTDEIKIGKQPLWVRGMLKMRSMLEMRKAFGDADPLLSKMYQCFVHYFFSTAAQYILVSVMIFGCIAFFANTNNVLLFFSVKHASLLLILSLLPLSLIEVALHELGHAFAVKAYGREVHYLGIGWYWFGPVAFTDTSDMWLAARKPRMIVNLAGIYVDLFMAGLASILIIMISNPYIQGILWLFALYTYIGAFRMLSPLQEMDGYYVLMDWLEKNRLRQAAVIWLIKIFPKSFAERSLFKKHKAEIGYWLACIVFLLLVTVLTLVLQAFVFDAFGIHTNHYVSLLLPFLVAVFSSLGILADIRNQTE